MTKDELISRLNGTEWTDFEVKEAKSELPKNIADSVSAFANTQGGWIVLGVRQEGKHFAVVGVDNAEKLEQDFISSLRNQSKYNTLISSRQQKYDIDGHTILAFYIYASDLKPVYFGGTIRNTFVRHGSGDQRATEAEVNAMFRDQQYGLKSEQSIADTSMDMLSLESLGSFRSYVFKQPIVPLNENCTNEEFCRALKIIDDKGLLTYSGLLMFGQRIYVRDHVPTFCLDYIEIPGRSLEEADTRYDYRMPEQANIWDSFVIMQRRLATVIQRPFALDAQGLIEVGDNRYFEVAREALANMVMHADYFSSFRSCVHVFTDRVEFQNGGSLPIPAEQMLGQFYTNPRNPSIAQMFRVAHIAENAGFGMTKLRSWTKLTGGRTQLTSQWLYTCFIMYLDQDIVESREKALQKIREKTGENSTLKTPQKSIQKTEDGIVENITENQTDNQTNTTQKTMEKTREKSTQKTREKSIQKTTQKSIQKSIQKTAQRVIECIQRNPDITTQQIAIDLGLTRVAIAKQIRKLQLQGIIRRVGPDKGGHWEIISK